MPPYTRYTNEQILGAEGINELQVGIEDTDAALIAHKNDTSNPHSVTKAQVGLSNVDNTADASKPISAAAQMALNGKSDSGHTHDTRYYTEDEVDTKLAAKSDTTHLHDDRYYTEAETDTKLSEKANVTHTHNALTDLTATGTKSSSTFLRGDNTWATPANTTYSLATQAEVEDAASVTARLVSGQRLSQAVLKHAPVKTADLALKADASSLSAHTGNTSNPHNVTKAQVGLGSVPNVDATARSTHTGTQLAATISDFSAAADARINAQKAVASGLATLDSTGKVPPAQLPALALTKVSVVATEAAQLALVAQEGDVAIRSDIKRSYIHNGGTTGTMTDWTELASSSDYAPLIHDHDDRYYTETEVNTLLSGKSDTTHDHLGTYVEFTSYGAVGTGFVTGGLAQSSLSGRKAVGAKLLPTSTEAGVSDIIARSDHLHDARYYTEEEIDTQMGAKADLAHTHGLADIVASGTRSSSTFLRGDGTWTTTPNTTYALLTQAQAQSNTDTTAGLVSGLRLTQAVANSTPMAHTHDDRYYTESESNARFSLTGASNGAWSSFGRIAGTQVNIADGATKALHSFTGYATAGTCVVLITVTLNIYGDLGTTGASHIRLTVNGTNYDSGIMQHDQGVDAGVTHTFGIRGTYPSSFPVVINTVCSSGVYTVRSGMYSIFTMLTTNT